MARRIIVYRRASLTGWRALLALFLVALVLYLTIVAFFALLSFAVSIVIMALIGAAIYRMLSGGWPIRFK